jgi:hypothetical protein
MRRARVAGLAPLAVGLLLSVGCSRQPGVLASDQSPASDQQVPFDASHGTGVFPTASLPLADVPAGTPLTVRMRSALSSATSQSGDNFDAVLDEPITVEGQVIVPRGSAVAGRVVAARASTGPTEAGYLRLSLTAITLHGHLLPVETSSVFLKGAPPGPQNLMPAGGDQEATDVTVKSDVEFPAGRRLVFRLTRVLPVR